MGDPLRVRLVEDHPDIGLLFDGWLRDEPSIELLHPAYRTAEEAQAAGGWERVDVLVTDLRLAGQMTGDLLARWVQAEYPHVWCVLQTAITGLTSEEREPFDRVLTKPMGMTSLLGAIAGGR